MKVYLIVWSKRTGVDEASTHIDEMAFETREGAEFYIEEQGFKKNDIFGYVKGDTSASVRSIEIKNMISTKEGPIII